MKSLKLVLVMLLSLFCLFSAGAQAQKTVGVWDYQKELGLTADQVTQLKKLFAALEQRTQADRDKDRALSQEVNTMVQGNASLSAIKAKLTEGAMVMVDMKLADVETSRAMNKILTPEQLKKWTDIRNQALKNGAH